MSRALPIVMVIIVVAAAAVLGFVLFGGDDGDGSGDSAEEVTVPGNAAFVDTGINLKSGDEVTITATGTVIHDLETDPTLVSGPDGDADRTDLRQFNVAGLREEDHANLIGKIGESGEPFAVGSALDFTADSDGRLFLGINDVGVGNNGGEYEARVSVSR